MSQPTFETILYAVEDGIATITLNRPDRLNAFTAQMMLDMIAAFDATDADDAVGAVIVTGAGRAFCAGADLSAGGATFDRDARPNPARERVGDVERDGGGRLTLRIFDSLKPVIAAVNGPAVGVGVTMQLAMDIRLASSTRASASCSLAAVSRRRPPRHGSCPGSWASRRRWNGATQDGCFRPRKPSTGAWCDRSTRRRIYCRRPGPWPAKWSTTAPRSPSPSPAR
jgi:hypothetical protein